MTQRHHLGSPNTSAAVMNQRHEPADSLDFFPTPPWGTRALCAHVLEPTDWLGKTVWEPACGRLHMARPLAEYFAEVRASDVHDWGAGAELRDFLLPEREEERPDWIITNPPFVLALEFAERALSVARLGVALLVRLSWLTTDERYQFFRRFPPAIRAPFMGRLPMHKGTCLRGASTATDYVWMVWRLGYSGRGDWVEIPPDARSRLERWGDYDDDVGPEPAVRRRRTSRREPASEQQVLL